MPNPLDYSARSQIMLRSDRFVQANRVPLMALSTFGLLGAISRRRP